MSKKKTESNGVCFGLAAAAMLFASTAEAKVLEGPMLQGNGSDFYSCNIVNVGKKPQDIQIEVWDHDSLLSGPTAFTLQPSAGAGVTAGFGSAGFRRCRFILPGSTKGVAATMSTGPSIHTPQVVVPIK